MRKLTVEELQNVSGGLVGGLLGGLPIVGGLAGGIGAGPSKPEAAAAPEAEKVSVLNGIPLLGPLLGSLIKVG